MWFERGTREKSYLALSISYYYVTIFILCNTVRNKIHIHPRRESAEEYKKTRFHSISEPPFRQQDPPPCRKKYLTHACNVLVQTSPCLMWSPCALTRIDDAEVMSGSCLNLSSLFIISRKRWAILLFYDVMNTATGFANKRKKIDNSIQRHDTESEKSEKRTQPTRIERGRLGTISSQLTITPPSLLHATHVRHCPINPAQQKSAE